jgi:hypothetical protein
VNQRLSVGALAVRSPRVAIDAGNVKSKSKLGCFTENAFSTSAANSFIGVSQYLFILLHMFKKPAFFIVKAYVPHKVNCFAIKTAEHILTSQNI